MDSADPPVAIDRFYGNCRRQLRRHGAGGTSCLGRLLATAPALSANVHRAIYVRAALCGQVAQRVTRRPMGRTRYFLGVIGLLSPSAAIIHGVAIWVHGSETDGQKKNPATRSGSLG